MKYLAFIFTVSLGLSATAYQGHPVNITANGDGVSFSLNCSPTENSAIYKIKKLARTMEAEIKSRLTDIHCEVLKLKHPSTACANEGSGTEKSCQKKGPRYQLSASQTTLTQVLMSAFEAQSEIKVDGETSPHSDVVYVQSIQVD